jgi:MFS family permease
MSGFWAIARTEVFDVGGTAHSGKTLATFSNMRQLADGFGRLIIGFVLTYFAFQGAFALVFLFSIIMVILVLTSHERNDGNIHVDKKNFKRIFHKHPPTFWYAAFLQLLVWLPYNMLLGFVIPLYMASSLKMGYYEVGLALAGLSIAAAVFAIILMKLNISKHGTLLLTLVSVPALVLFPLAGSNLIFPLFLLAIGTGCSNIIGEYILVDQVYRSKNVSTDIGVLYAPLKLAEFLFLSISGLVISMFGFTLLFSVLALSISIFVLLGLAIIRSGHSAKS